MRLKEYKRFMYSSKFKGVYKGLFKNLNHISWLRKKRKEEKKWQQKKI